MDFYVVVDQIVELLRSRGPPDVTVHEAVHLAHEVLHLFSLAFTLSITATIHMIRHHGEPQI